MGLLFLVYDSRGHERLARVVRDGTKVRYYLNREKLELVPSGDNMFHVAETGDHYTRLAPEDGSGSLEGLDAQ